MVARMYDHGRGLNNARYFEIDDIIDPADSRKWIMRMLKTAPSPAPREGKKRHVDTW
jgi:acetyl-CoA carboxylase carboxyltransferase component